jgi:cobyrinic acid a,c-diamide synthase
MVDLDPNFRARSRPKFLIAATLKSSGKTTISVGLARAYAKNGLAVQTFKKGPDYIDPMWLARASGRPCINLDFYTMSCAEIETLYRRYSRDADVVVVEGNKGLHDGLDTDGSNSNAALAKLLDLPVILLVDTLGITRGIAPLLHGYETFDQEVRFAGIVLNKVGGPRHEQKLRDAITYYSDIPVLGAIHRSEDMAINERHIGLTPSNEDQQALARIQAIAGVISKSVNIDEILNLTRQAKAPDPLVYTESPVVPGVRLHIGVARDVAFGFYYPDDLELMNRLGAKVHYFDTLRDKALPDVDALFIGGGFPELYLDELSGNAGLKADIRRFVDSGKPVYAECGGLMYLCRNITYDGVTRPMVGALSANVRMQSKPVGRGYVKLRETSEHPWPVLGLEAPRVLPAHEFHYSQLDDLGDDAVFAYEVVRGVGITDRFDGLVYKNTLATYTHHRNVGDNRWVERFIAHIVRCNKEQNNAH